MRLIRRLVKRVRALFECMTQKEMVVRYLNRRRGQWIYGYELVKKTASVIGKDYLIQDADTRAHELSRIGYYNSTNNRYFIEHRRKGKYAQFRVTLVEPLVSWQEHNREALALFDSLK